MKVYFKEYKKTKKFQRWQEAYSKRYFNLMRDKIYEQRRTYRSTPRMRLQSNVATAIWHSLRQNKGGHKWEKLLGFTLKDLMEHLEKQFDEKMTWRNYGSYWWIDHIRPISSFRFDSYEDKDFKKCWALNNLCPLEAKENIRKGNKIIESLINEMKK